MTENTGSMQESTETSEFEGTQSPDNATGQGISSGAEEVQQKSGKRTYTDDEVKEMIKARLERDRKSQASKAEEKAAEERKEWEKLAITRANRIGELEPVAERVETLEGVVQKYVDAEREGLPNHILTLLDKMPVEEQLDYITTHRADLIQPPVEETPSVRRAPDASKQRSGSTTFDREKGQFNQALRQRGLRS